MVANGLLLLPIGYSSVSIFPPPLHLIGRCQLVPEFTVMCRIMLGLDVLCRMRNECIESCTDSMFGECVRGQKEEGENRQIHPALAYDVGIVRYGNREY